MKFSSVAQASLLLALIIGCFVVEAAKHRLTVKKYKAKFRIDWWDNGRFDPYRVIFKKSGIKSIYKFLESGSLSTLTIGNTEYTFYQGAGAVDVESSDEIESRMLLADEDEDVLDEVHTLHRRLYECTNCEETWDTLCDVSIVEVCGWVELLPFIFNDDAQYSLTVMCTAMGAACETSAADTCDGQCTGDGPAPEPTPAPIFELTSAPIPDTTPNTPAPVDEPAPATPAPIDDETPEDACNPSPCENGGSCSLDPAGGHTCSCASGFGGMACQTDTSSLDAFYIDIDFVGTWTDSRKAVFQSAADRWSEVITHVPCGGSDESPGGRLLITSTLEGIDGSGGILGSAGPTRFWSRCRTVSFVGVMTFDIDDIASMEDNGTFEGVILHEMGHVIGVGTLWGDNFGECTTCYENNDPAWNCPAAVSAYADLGGSGADIVELDGGSGTACGHLDEVIFTDELMTGYVDYVMYLSKMTAAILDDLDYVVDPSAVNPYVLPSERGGSINTDSEVTTSISDTAVDAILLAVDSDGNVVDEVAGYAMQF